MSAIPTELTAEFIYPIFQQQIDAGAEVLELRVSHSSMTGSYASCARKFEFGKLFSYSRYDDNEEGGSLAAEVGHALHRGHQIFMATRDKDLAFAEMMMRYPISLNDNPMNYHSVEACYGTLQNMMNMPAMSEYEIAQIKLQDGSLRSAYEVPFEIRISGYHMEYAGRKVVVVYSGFIDLIVWNIISKQYHVIDIKTTRNDAKDKTAMYHNDEQALPYGIVVSQLVGQNIAELDVHYLSVYVDALEPKSQLYSFKKTDRDLRDWGRTLLFRMQAINAYMDLNWFPRTGSACMNFKRNCSYFEACRYRDVNAITHFMDTNDKNSLAVVKEPWIKIDLELAA